MTTTAEKLAAARKKLQETEKEIDKLVMQQEKESKSGAVPDDFDDCFYYFLGLQLKKQRELLGHSINDQVRRIGFSRSSVSQWESGKQRIPLHVLNHVAWTGLGVSPASLLNKADKAMTKWLNE